MSRLAFIFRTDVHLADKGPDTWKADYTAELWSDLEQIGELARSSRAKAVLDGGDYFHIKQASRNSHLLVSRSASIQKCYPCPTYAIEGNHDITYNDVETIEKQPLGVLFATGVFQRLRDEVFEEGDLRVRVMGLPYHPKRTLEELQALRKQPGDTHLIVVLHQLATENPSGQVQDFFGEPVFRYDQLIQDGGPDVVCLGHWHKDQGITQIAGRQFVNLGAVSRGALTNENLSRIPQVALIVCDSNGVAVTPLPLTVAPADQVFDLERKEREKTESQSIEQFVTRLQQDSLIDGSKSIEANVEALGFAREVRDVALEYLERARMEVG